VKRYGQSELSSWNFTNWQKPWKTQISLMKTGEQKTCSEKRGRLRGYSCIKRSCRPYEGKEGMSSAAKEKFRAQARTDQLSRFTGQAARSRSVPGAWLQGAENDLNAPRESDGSKARWRVQSQLPK